MIYEQEITLDLNSNTAYTTIGAKQGDSNSREVKIHITENGKDYNLKDNNINTAYFRFRKPDGKAVINQATIDKDNNVITILLTAQTLAVAGRGYADITLQDGAQILSTVSFIIIIMSAPQVADQAISSDEFGYLNQVVENATHIIYEAEAWAAGTRGLKEVYGENILSDPPVGTGSGIMDLRWMTTEEVQDEEDPTKTGQDVFKEKVGQQAGVQRVFKFLSINGDSVSSVSEVMWSLSVTSIEGITETKTELGDINSLSSYGIYINNNQIPVTGSYITVIFSEADNAYQNNAKYYSELADADRQAIENFEITAKAGPSLEDGAIIEVEKEVDPETGAVSFELTIPKGNTGDVNFMTLDIDPTDGTLYMFRPTELENQVSFSMGKDDGCLYLEMESGE